MKIATILLAAFRSATTQQTKSRLEKVEWAPDYAEPGCALSCRNKKAGIYLGDWNPPSVYDATTRRRVDVEDGHILPRLKKALKKAGANVEWSDEWEPCQNCRRIGSTIPDSFGWQSCMVVDLAQESCLCKDCSTGEADETDVA